MFDVLEETWGPEQVIRELHRQGLGSQGRILMISKSQKFRLGLGLLQFLQRLDLAETERLDQEKTQEAKIQKQEQVQEKVQDQEEAR